MKFHTTKFGTLEIDSERIILFPDGIAGFESHRHWVLLVESDEETVGWLQSLTDPALAFLVVTPHRFVPGFSLVVDRSDLITLPWSRDDQTLTLVIVSDHEGTLTANLRAPILINIDRCLGRQVLTADDQAIQHVLRVKSAPLRKTA